jgi:hypothetical protein
MENLITQIFSQEPAYDPASARNAVPQNQSRAAQNGNFTNPEKIDDLDIDDLAVIPMPLIACVGGSIEGTIAVKSVIDPLMVFGAHKNSNLAKSASIRPLIVGFLPDGLLEGTVEDFSAFLDVPNCFGILHKVSRRDTQVGRASVNIALVDAIGGAEDYNVELSLSEKEMFVFQLNTAPQFDLTSSIAKTAGVGAAPKYTTAVFSTVETDSAVDHIAKIFGPMVAKITGNNVVVASTPLVATQKLLNDLSNAMVGDQLDQFSMAIVNGYLK